MWHLNLVVEVFFSLFLEIITDCMTMNRVCSEIQALVTVSVCVCVLYMCVFCWIFYSVSSGLFLWHVIYFVSGDCVFCCCYFSFSAINDSNSIISEAIAKLEFGILAPDSGMHSCASFFCFNKFIALGSERSAHAWCVFFFPLLLNSLQTTRMIATMIEVHFSHSKYWWRNNRNTFSSVVWIYSLHK